MFAVILWTCTHHCSHLWFSRVLFKAGYSSVTIKIIKMKPLLGFLLLIIMLTSSCKKMEDFSYEKPPTFWKPVALYNPSFEQKLEGWDITREGDGKFTIQTWPDQSGLYLLFYDPTNRTSFNGSVTQTISGLPNGHYRFNMWGQKYGEGMYLVANDKIVPLTDEWTRMFLEFDVTDGDARIGIACMGATGDTPEKPSSWVDFAELEQQTIK
jgi:hypothetical protein